MAGSEGTSEEGASQRCPFFVFRFRPGEGETEWGRRELFHLNGAIHGAPSMAFLPFPIQVHRIAAGRGVE